VEREDANNMRVDLATQVLEKIWKTEPNVLKSEVSSVIGVH